MDIKIRGISIDIMRNALEQARDGRMHILERMAAAMDSPRDHLSPFAPRLTSFKIPVELIGALIGPGGKNIRAIVADSGAEVNVEDDGTVVVAATSQESADKAIYAIKKIAEVPEVGKVYRATVKKVTDFGAFVEFLPGKEGLVHVSQLDVKRVNKPSDVVKVGDVFDVKITDQDDQGRYKLSKKVLMQGYQESAGGERPHEGDREQHKH
jgi:polyribonucleotide nucleotidyltransferase